MNNYAKKLRESSVWDKEFKDWDDALDNGVLKSDDVPIQNKALLSIFRAGNIVEQIINENLEIYDLSIPQKNVLDALYFCKKEYMTQDELSKFVFSSKGNISTLLTRMKVKGLIKREDNPDNKRQKKISITKKGIEKMELIIEANKDFTMDFLSDNDCKQIIELLRKFRHNFKGVCNEKKGK